MTNEEKTNDFIKGSIIGSVASLVVASSINFIIKHNKRKKREEEKFEEKVRAHKEAIEKCKNVEYAFNQLITKDNNKKIDLEDTITQLTSQVYDTIQTTVNNMSISDRLCFGITNTLYKFYPSINIDELDPKLKYFIYDYCRLFILKRIKDMGINNDLKNQIFKFVYKYLLCEEPLNVNQTQKYLTKMLNKNQMILDNLSFSDLIKTKTTEIISEFYKGKCEFNDYWEKLIRILNLFASDIKNEIKSRFSHFTKESFINETDSKVMWDCINKII